MAKKVQRIHWKTILFVVLIVAIGVGIAWYATDDVRYSPDQYAQLLTAVTVAEDNLAVAQDDLDACLGQQGNEEADCFSEQSIVDAYAESVRLAQEAVDAYDDGSAVDSGSGDDGSTIDDDACEEAGRYDVDADGYCSVVVGGSMADCNDGDDAVHPEASEVCDDTKDNDCNSFTDCADTSACEGSASAGVGTYAGVCCAGVNKGVNTFVTDTLNCGSCGTVCTGRFNPSGWVADVCVAGKCEAPGCANPPSARCFGPGTTQDDALGRMASTVDDLLTVCGWNIGWDSDAGCISFSRSY